MADERFTEPSAYKVVPTEATDSAYHETRDGLRRWLEERGPDCEAFRAYVAGLETYHGYEPEEDFYHRWLMEEAAKETDDATD